MEWLIRDLRVAANNYRLGKIDERTWGWERGYFSGFLNARAHEISDDNLRAWRAESDFLYQYAAR